MRSIFLMQEVPQHAWLYEEWLRECLDDDEDDEDAEANEEEPAGDDPTSDLERLSSRAWHKPTSSDESSSDSRPRPRLPPRCPSSKSSSANSSPDRHPQRPQDVQLDYVQDLSAVFERAYSSTPVFTLCKRRLCFLVFAEMCFQIQVQMEKLSELFDFAPILMILCMFFPSQNAYFRLTAEVA